MAKVSFYVYSDLHVVWCTVDRFGLVETFVCVCVLKIKALLCKMAQTVPHTLLFQPISNKGSFVANPRMGWRGGVWECCCQCWYFENVYTLIWGRSLWRRFELRCVFFWGLLAQIYNSLSETCWGAVLFFRYRRLSQSFFINGALWFCEEDGERERGRWVLK